MQPEQYRLVSGVLLHLEFHPLTKHTGFPHKIQFLSCHHFMFGKKKLSQFSYNIFHIVDNALH